MKQPTWGDHRRPDQTLDLATCMEEALSGSPPLNFPEEAINFLEQVEALHPITSRQVAAVVLIEAERRGKVGAP